jgi:hypothetical protein
VSWGLLPAILKLGIYTFIPDFEWQSSKDNFHIPSSSIDKTTIFDMVNSTIPIEFSLSKGGDGWRKTFKISSLNCSHRKFTIRPLILFKGLPEKEIAFHKINPDKGNAFVTRGRNAALQRRKFNEKSKGKIH